ncbi:MAG: choice-of-anchor K domain-containing protein [Armatimonadetes bacterium]|nr:choice-of-anchor K domain-containing protein [Armatimonadota bacterium]
MKYLKVCLVLLSLMLLVASVHAADVAGTGSGIFENSIGPSGKVVSGEGTNLFKWGKSVIPAKFGGKPSSLLFQGIAFSGDCDGSPFAIGNLFFHNGLIWGGTEATGVDLKISLDFALPSIGVKTLTYDLALDNNFFLNGDTVASMGTTPASVSFLANGKNYTVELLKFDDLFACEGQNDCVTVYASATCEPVPEPGSLLVLGNGLLGLAWTVRRRFVRS